MTDSEELDALAAAVIERTPHLGGLPAADRTSLLAHGRVRRADAGEHLCRQQLAHDCLYLVLTGSVTVEAEVQRRRVTLGTLGPGDLCGEISALFEVPASATARVTEAAVLLEVPGPAARAWMRRHRSLSEAVFALSRERIVFRALRTVPLFSAVPDGGLEWLADEATLLSFPKEGTVVREGEFGDAFYVILSGMVQVYRDAEGARVEMGVLKPGDYFGEWSLLTGAPRSGTVAALTQVDLVRVECRPFLDFIQRHPHVRDGIDLVAHNRRAQVPPVAAGAREPTE